MNLIDCNIRPGKVAQVVDTRGCIKVYAPGLFSEQDSPDLLPPVYPLGLQHYGQFSSLLEGDKVWILSNNGNSQQFFYIRYNIIPTNIKMKLDNGDANVEVLFSREGKDGLAQIFFNDSEGIIISNGDAIIKMNEDKILLSTPGVSRTIEISNNGISLGSEGGSSEPAVLGDKLVDVLDDIYNILNNINNNVTNSPYTAHLKPAFISLESLKNNITKITSSHVTLD